MKNFLLTPIAIIALTILPSTACKTSSSASQVKHEVDTAVETDSKLSWATQPYDEFLRELRIKPEAIQNTIFPSETPIAKRLQLWVDTIDTELRTNDKTGMFQHIPKPQVRLINYPQENAYVKVAWYQFENVFFAMNDAELKELVPTEYAVTLLNGNFLYDKREGVKVRATVEDLRKQLERVIGLFTECELVLKERSDGNIIVTPKSKDCNFSPEINAEPTKAWSFLLPTTGSDFVVYSGLLKAISEDEAVYVLAHELKHYYGSQIAIKGKNYFFKLTPENNAHLPLPDPEMTILNQNFDETYKQIIRAINKRSNLLKNMDTRIFAKISDQKIHSYLAGPLVTRAHMYEAYLRTLMNTSNSEIGRKMGERGKILALGDKATDEEKARAKTLEQEIGELSMKTSSAGGVAGFCQSARHGMLGSKVLNEIYQGANTFGITGQLSEVDQKMYKGWEQMVIPCLNFTKIVADKDFDPQRDTGLEKISASQILELLSNLNFGVPTANIPALEGSFGDFFVKVSERMRNENKFDFDEQAYADFDQKRTELKPLDSFIQNKSFELRMLGEGGKTRGVGYYTIEQEADEAATEWLARIGLDPSAGIRSSFALIPSGELRTDCMNKYKNGWLDSEGKPVLIPWGNFGTALHPDQCYRARNIDMEIKAHSYKVGPTKIPLLSESEWQSLVADMADRQQKMEASLDQKLAVTSALLKQEKSQICGYARSDSNCVDTCLK